VTEEKIEIFRHVLNQRTRHITVVLEDIYQPHNASAVLRSCDGFGIQDVHIIENRNYFEVSKGVTIGSDKWLTIKRYNQLKINNSALCMNRLRDEGYRIIATTPHENDYDLPDLAITDKTAVFFGAEKEGLSQYILDEADDYVKIPMYGFSESFNISVSVALTLYDLTSRLRKSNLNWQLNEKEKFDLMLEWVKKSIRRSDLIEQKFNEQSN
jgi:tRNA (guanosine-2'-O-)-methyltransferase